MPHTFSTQTPLIYGHDALRAIPDLAKEAGMRKPLLVSDPIISTQDFYSGIVQSLKTAGLSVAAYSGCSVDARVDEIDEQSERSRKEGIDGVIAVGGGSVMCAAKGIAIAAPAMMKSVREAEGAPVSRIRPWPMIMVPTTAGSGSEVSRFAIIFDTDGGKRRRFVIGASTSFPNFAVLDPVVLAKLPRRLAAISSADALAHAIEPIFSTLATPLTDALALQAIRMLAGCMRSSIVSGDREAQATNLLAASVANMAFGNCRVGLTHLLGEGLEMTCDVAHGIAVGVLAPRVILFNAEAAPDRIALLADAFGVSGSGSNRAEAVVDAIYHLYDDIGFSRCFEPKDVDPARIGELAIMAAMPHHGPAVSPDGIKDDTPVDSPNIRRASVRDARTIYTNCFRSAGQ